MFHQGYNKCYQDALFKHKNGRNWMVIIWVHWVANKETNCGQWHWSIWLWYKTAPLVATRIALPRNHPIRSEHIFSQTHGTLPPKKKLSACLVWTRDFLGQKEKSTKITPSKKEEQNLPIQISAARRVEEWIVVQPQVISEPPQGSTWDLWWVDQPEPGWMSWKPWVELTGSCGS